MESTTICMPDVSAVVSHSKDATKMWTVNLKPLAWIRMFVTQPAQSCFCQTLQIHRCLVRLWRCCSCDQSSPSELGRWQRWRDPRSKWKDGRTGPWRKSRVTSGHLQLNMNKTFFNKRIMVHTISGVWNFDTGRSALTFAIQRYPKEAFNSLVDGPWWALCLLKKPIKCPRLKFGNSWKANPALGDENTVPIGFCDLG